MELSYQLLAGAAGGLASVLLLGLAAPLILRLRSFTPGIWRQTRATWQIAHAAIQMIAGVGLGLLFWLSWGLAAVVNIGWWQRGAVFGAVAWGVLAVPVLIGNSISFPVEWRAALVTMMEWLCTALCAGLACSWVWARNM